MKNHTQTYQLPETLAPGSQTKLVPYFKILKSSQKCSKVGGRRCLKNQHSHQKQVHGASQNLSSMNQLQAEKPIPFPKIPTSLQISIDPMPSVLHPSGPKNIFAGELPCIWEATLYHARAPPSLFPKKLNTR